MKPIYNKEGELEDFSDEGEQAERLLNEIDLSLALDRLPARKRQVFKLKLEGYSSEEIAVKLGIKVKTVDNHINQVNQKLREEAIEFNQD